MEGAQVTPEREELASTTSASSFGKGKEGLETF